MDINKFFKNYNPKNIKILPYSIEIFDDYGNNILWSNHDGRFYIKSFVLTQVGHKETSVYGVRKNIHTGLPETFWRNTVYDLQTGEVLKEDCSDGFENKNNWYKNKLGQTQEVFSSKKIVIKKAAQQYQESTSLF